MPTNLSDVVKRIAALKPLVIGGALVAGVALTAGSPYTSKGAADAAIRMQTYAMTMSAENGVDSLKALRHGLHAIAELDLSRLEPSTAATTIRAMAAQTAKDCVFLSPANDTDREAMSTLRTEGVKAMEASVDKASAERASFDRAIAIPTVEGKSIDASQAAAATLKKATVTGNYAKDTLTRIAGAPDARPSVMQQVARNALSKLGDATPEAVAGTVAERLEASVASKRDALTNIVKMIDDAQSQATEQQGPTDETTSQISSSADAVGDLAPADRVSLRAVAAHYALHPEESHDAKRAVTASVQAELLDASLSSVIALIDKGGDDSLPLARTLAATGVAQADAIGMRIEARADAGMTASPAP